MRRKGKRSTGLSKAKQERSRKLRSLLFPPGAEPKKIDLEELMQKRKTGR